MDNAHDHRFTSLSPDAKCVNGCNKIQGDTVMAAYYEREKEREAAARASMDGLGDAELAANLEWFARNRNSMEKPYLYEPSLL